MPGIFSQDQQDLILELPKKKRAVLVGVLLLYVFKGTKQSSMRELLAPYSGVFSFLDWRRTLHSNGALLRDGKVYAYGLSYPNRSKRVHEILDSVDLDDVSRQLIREGLSYQPLKNKLARLSEDEFCRAKTVHELNDFISAVLVSKDLRAYTRHFIRSKMSFLIKSFRLSVADLQSDLLSWALFSLLKTYPRFEDVGHGLAIAKTVIHNRGINIIKTQVSAKSNVLTQNSDGSYSSKIVSIDLFGGGESGISLDDSDDTGNVGSDLIVGLDGSPRASISHSLKSSLSNLMNSGMLRPRQRRFLNLCAGVPSEEFSNFLSCPNDVYMDRVEFDVYLNKVCAFMSISPAAGDNFLKSLRQHL